MLIQKENVDVYIKAAVQYYMKCVMRYTATALILNYKSSASKHQYIVHNIQNKRTDKQTDKHRMASQSMADNKGILQMDSIDCRTWH